VPPEPAPLAQPGDIRNLCVLQTLGPAAREQLLDLGFTVDQVAHDYGDPCQAITDLAVESGAPFAGANSAP